MNTREYLNHLDDDLFFDENARSFQKIKRKKKINKDAPKAPRKRGKGDTEDWN